MTLFTYSRKIGIAIFAVNLFLLFGNVQALGGSIGEDIFHSRLHQYIDIEYDSSILNQTFDIQKSINVPLKIIYWTDMRDNILRWLVPWRIRNLILFGKVIPQQKICINITNKPDWAEITVVQPILTTRVPRVDMSKDVQKVTFPPVDEVVTFISSLIISPLEEAPSRMYSIGIKVTCEEMGMLKKAVFQKNIIFKPVFSPNIQIQPEKPIQMAKPHGIVNFKIKVTNFSNKRVRVIPNLSNSTKWKPIINPPFIDIDPSVQKEFYFSVYAPADFGWHDTTKSFIIDFTAVSFPLTNNSIIGGSYQLIVTVNNYGFSIPGFETTVALASLLLLFGLRRRYLREKRGLREKIGKIRGILILFSMIIIILSSQYGEAKSLKREAGVNLYIEGEIPSVHPSKWTNINLTLVDCCGINWTRFSKNFKPWQRNLLLCINPEWRRYFGNTTLKLEANVIGENVKGWHVRFNRSTITETTAGCVHRVQLQAMVDDSVVDYSVIVEIRCIRFDVFGDIMGVSYLYFPLKAIPVSNIHMKNPQEKIVSPKTLVDIDLSITNYGNYRETLGFIVETEDDEVIARLDTQTLVLDPKEEKQITLRVLASETFIDFGTPHQINIYTYPTKGDTEAIYIGSITIVTRGIYFSPLIGIIGVPLLSITLICCLLWYRRRKHRPLRKI